MIADYTPAIIIAMLIVNLMIIHYTPARMIAM